MTTPRALLAWLILFVIAFLNGALREFTYSSWLTQLIAHQVSCGLGIVLFGVTIWSINRVWPFRSGRQAWRIGILWTALTIVWEFCFGRLVMGHSWSRLLGDYAIWRGRLWSVVLLSLLLLPALVRLFDEWRGKRKPEIAACLLWALAVWAVCALSIVTLRATVGLETALWVHLAVAPLVSLAATLAYRNHPGRLAAVPTAVLFLLFAVATDALLVAPFVERSFAMFRSPIGTWVPFALIFAGSLAASRLRNTAQVCACSGSTRKLKP